MHRDLVPVPELPFGGGAERHEAVDPSPANFRGLVLGCTEAKFFKKIFV